ncbi:aldo/keto reductase [Glycomyces endophyticus]
MRYTPLGSTGTKVSRIGLGCMSFGEPGRGPHPWTLGEDASRGVIRAALDAGVNFFDTANVYSAGSSEEIVGRALADLAARDRVVLATKVFHATGPGPNDAGLSRRAVMAAIDRSLRRLRTDHVDLYQIHRWDPETPIEETMEALHDVVKAGKARYLGASSMFAWQFAKAQHTADLHGWTRFVTMQGHYNLLYREEEREMLPLCRDQGVGCLPWSPLARGRLASPPGVRPARADGDPLFDRLYAGSEDADRAIVERVGRIAADRSATRAQVALAWLWREPAVAAPVVGVDSVEQLAEAVAAVGLELDDEEAAFLEAPYAPRPVAGFEDGRTRPAMASAPPKPLGR